MERGVDNELLSAGLGTPCRNMMDPQHLDQKEEKQEILSIEKISSYTVYKKNST